MKPFISHRCGVKSWTTANIEHREILQPLVLNRAHESFKMVLDGCSVFTALKVMPRYPVVRANSGVAVKGYHG
jgi:hypothetical protein